MRFDYEQNIEYLPNLRNESQINNDESIIQTSSRNKVQLKQARFIEKDSSSDDPKKNKNKKIKIKVNQILLFFQFEQARRIHQENQMLLKIPEQHK